MSGFADGMHHLTPYFTVKDADGFMRFVRDVFDGVVIKENRYDSGAVQHVRMRINDSVLMLNEASAEYPALCAQMHLFVPDAGATLARALAAGASTIMDLNIRPHGDQMAGIKDPFGNIWWLATPAT